MRVLPQIAVIVLICAVAVPVSARLVPGTRPWLDRAGLLQPLVTLGLVHSPSAGEGKDKGGGGAGSRSATVIADKVQAQPMRDMISAIGSARGAQSVDLSFGVSGRLRTLRVAPGDRVAAGAPVAELDAQAAELAVDRARLILEDRQRTVDRLGQLAQSGTSTALQRQDAELALRTAELELQSALRDLDDHRLASPIGGYVGLIDAQVGDLVASSTVLTRIEDRSRLLIDFRVPERVAAQVAVGDVVQVAAISAPQEMTTGRVVAVDNRVDEASRSLRVQAVIENLDDRFRAGMGFRIDLAFTGDNVPAVDPLAIQWGADGAFVWVVREDKAVRVPVRILQRNADAVLVEAGFQADDLVVSEGVQSLRPGVDVTVAEPRT